MQNKKNENNKKEMFIPSLEQWGELYDLWFKPMVASLAVYAPRLDCEEAVHGAFLKVMGLSQNLKLRKPLEPRTLNQWYCFVRWHARSVLSHMQERASRFECLPPEENLPTSATDRCTRLDRMRRVICSAVRKVCRGWKDPDAKSNAFIKFKLDEMSAADVVREIPETLNPNNLYQLCDRIRRALAEEAARPDSPLGELRCA